MNTFREMPIGIQNFEKLRNDGYVYVDKTAFVWKLVRTSRSYFLSRPRRFGKSLFLSTIEAYFQGKKELFQGLAIEKLEAEYTKEPWQSYPIFHMDFNKGFYETRASLEAVLNRALEKWEKLYGSEDAETSFALRFYGLIERAYEKTGKQVVILIDEYDKPLLHTLHRNDELDDTFRSILKAFYSVIKSADQYIRFAFLTGVTKFSKVSIFSDLNNLVDISMRPDYAEICGITQEEIEANFASEIETLAEVTQQSVGETLAQLKQRYDGYCFCPNTNKLYNPFSVLNVFDGNAFKDFWFATGTPTFLVHFLKEAQYHIPDLDGDVEMSEADLEGYRAEKTSPLPILFQSGYLTIKSYDAEYRMYSLGYPNDEVRYGFLDNLLPAYTSIPKTQSAYSIASFTKDIKDGNVDGFMERMRSIIAGIPYDNLSGENLRLREQNYQAAIYLIFALMNQFVQTEVHCATGRADCIVETDTTVYIFEFKLNSAGTAEDAIAQIEEKDYAGKCKGLGKGIIAVGASFDDKARTVRDWKQKRR